MVLKLQTIQKRCTGETYSVLYIKGICLPDGDDCKS